MSSLTSISSCPVDSNGWHHLALVMDATGKTVYQDGQVICSDNVGLTSLGMGENGGDTSLRYRIGY